jgi:DNA repair protein RecO (recombination protein O)
VRGRSEICEAVLLRSVDYGDSDRIVTLLTSRFGKGAFLARGARRSRKRFGGALEPLCVLQVEIGSGQGTLGTLRQATVTRTFPRVLGELARMAAGFSSLELVPELSSEHDEDTGVFSTVLAFLSALDLRDIEPAKLALCFEMRLLSLQGLGPRLHECGSCGKRPGPAQAGQFDPTHGYLVCRECGGAPYLLAGELREALVRASGHGWLECARGSWSALEVDQASAALRAFTEHRIGRELRARSLAPSHGGAG